MFFGYRTLRSWTSKHGKFGKMLVIKKEKKRLFRPTLREFNKDKQIMTLVSRKFLNQILSVILKENDT